MFSFKEPFYHKNGNATFIFRLFLQVLEIELSVGARRT